MAPQRKLSDMNSDHFLGNCIRVVIVIETVFLAETMRSHVI